MTVAGDLRLGVLGLSPGNGHPYSWSAIFNGYDPAAMASCPYPAIPAYLARQKFPLDAIPHARVTHVWAQDRAVAEHVAAASLIPHVVDHHNEMIGAVDAILLARDDGENHLAMSLPFLDAGLPIYIDKPIALSLADLATMYEHQRFTGQIFSCSAMRYAEEFQIDAAARSALGDVTHVQATVVKNWDTYGMHLIDPVLNMLDLYDKDCEIRASRLGDGRVVIADWGSVAGTFTCLGSTPGGIEIRLFGSRSSRTFVFADSFAAFKRALQAFIGGVRAGREVTTRRELTSTVSLLERGRAS